MPSCSARAYALQVDSPYGSFYLFTDSTQLRLTGELRNLFAERLPRVFQAGFTQYLYVAAVDSNYYDYYSQYYDGRNHGRSGDDHALSQSQRRPVL